MVIVHWGACLTLAPIDAEYVALVSGGTVCHV